MKNTRFYPTLNGMAHFGHCVVALLNYHAAKAAGGVFIVRAELRTQYLYANPTMGMLQGWFDSYKRAFDFIGIEAEYMPLLHDGQWTDEQSKKHEALHRNDTKNELYPVLTCDGFAHPYSPVWCLERCLLDNRYAVGTVIRGVDLLSEHSLYVHFCKQLDLSVPVMQYCPLVQVKTAENKIIGISKTAGNCKVNSVINSGVSKHQLLDALSAVLVDPTKGWNLKNIKSNPVITDVKK